MEVVLLAILLVVIYSIIINYFFGHPTYWKSFPWEIYRYCIALYRKYYHRRSRHVIKDSSSDSSSFNVINFNVSIHVFTFLTPYEIATLSQVSMHFKDICEHKLLWDYFKKSTLQLCDNLRYDIFWKESITSFDLKRPPNVQFYLFYQDLIKQLLQLQSDDANCCIIRVNGKIYDLTEFKDEHPGGFNILSEWNRKDASRIFYLAGHSQLAKTLSTNFIIWSDTEVLGKKGMPKYVQKYIT